MSKLKIINCSDSLMWYRDKVGQYVELLYKTGDCYMSREDSGLANIVLVKDAIIIEEAMSKTPEEKAREYADGMLNVYESNIDKSSRNIQYFNAYELMDAYIDGYHSRDEEVKELIEALKECIENIECIEANVNHSEGFFSALMNATVFCEQAKQLLKQE